MIMDAEVGTDTAMEMMDMIMSMAISMRMVINTMMVTMITITTMTIKRLKT